MKRFFVVLVLFVVGCCGPIGTLSDEDLRVRYMAFSPGRAVLHDVLWSCGGKSLQYATCRKKIAKELMGRGYFWDGQRWTKEPPRQEEVSP